MKVDGHQHFWQLDRGDYDWITPDLAPLYRDFLPVDLAPLLAEASIDGTILVQAAPTLAETKFILSLAETTDFVKGVVGWVDFESRDAADQIARLADHPKLVGLRPMIQGIPDTDWMLGQNLAPAFDALIAHELTFDALTLPKHLPNLHTLLLRYPDMRVVIDHASKPDIAAKNFDTWAADMAALAQDTAAYCKLSGMVTEAAPNWSAADLHPYVTHLFNTFGPNRLIWGSDWPVCTLAGDYARWVTATDKLLSDCSTKERSAILGENAVVAYTLKD